MANWLIKQTIDLDNPGSRNERGPVSSGALMVEGDCQAHVWQVTVLKGGAAADLTGYTAVASFVRADGETVAVDGGISGNVASVCLAQECYAIKGPLKGIFRIVNSSTDDVLTTSVVHYTVQGGPTDEIVDPGEIIPSYEQVAAEYQNMQAAAAAAYAAAGAKFALAPYNAYELLNMIPLPYSGDMSSSYVVVHNGITYEWSGTSEERTCKVSGTASSASQCIIFPYNYSTNKSSFPQGLEPGKSYRIAHTSSKVTFSIYEYDSGGTSTQTTFNADGTFSLKSTTVGVRIRLFVASGTVLTTPEIVSPKIVYGWSSFVTRGVLPNNTDLDNVTDTGAYTLASARTYQHLPSALAGVVNTLEVMRGGDAIILQRLTFGGNGGRVYNRRSINGSFTYTEGGETVSVPWNRGVIEADIDALSREDANTRQALAPYNSIDIAALNTHANVSSNNVTYTWLDNNHCRIDTDGNASAAVASYIYYNVSALPAGFAPGKIIQIKCAYTPDEEDTANPWLTLRYYVNGAWTDPRYYISDASMRVPEGAVGMSCYFVVSNATSVNGDVEVAIISESNPGRQMEAKYVAYGDSLTLGAVWSATAGTALHYTTYEWRIPTRIARAVGAYNDFYNHGIGGIGYITKVNNKNLVDVITDANNDFSGTELVTVMAGANDRATAAGTLSAICTAIQSIITYFKTNWPKVQLVFIQPTPGSFDDTHNPWTSRNVGGWSLNDFDEAVSKLCYDAHVGYVSWNGCAYCDTWLARNIGYNGNTGPNYTHPVSDMDYALLGDFIAGKVAACGQNCKPMDDAGVKRYTKTDMDIGKYWHFRENYTYFNPFTGRKFNDQTFNCLYFPVKAGDAVRLRTKAGFGNAKPYALIGSNRIIYEVYPDTEAQSETNVFDGTIAIEQDGFVAVNVLSSGYYDFLCEVRTNAADELRRLDRINALPIQASRQQFLEYDDNDVCKVLVTGPSRMSMIHNWAIIGASFDSGEFNHALTVYPTIADYQAGTNGKTHWAEYEGYEYSCFEYLKRINGIPNLYMYANGGQNSRDWIRYGLADRPARTWVYTTGELEVATPYWEDGHFWYISDDPDDPRGCTYHPGTETEPAYYTPGGNIAPYRTGAGHAGGNWWKLREDLEAGKRYNAYLINLGSNDLNNNHGFDGDPVAPSEAPAYDAGTMDDIGTYDRTTNTDTVPEGKTAGIVPGVVNSYAAYMGAILNRIFAYQPDAIVFVATIRNGFSQTSERLDAWNEYNDVLKDIVASATTEGGLYYGKKLYLLDNAAFGPCYDVPPMNGMFVHNHPNALGYQYIAGYWNTLIDHAIQKNYLAMQQSMFIGTNMTGTV